MLKSYLVIAWRNGAAVRLSDVAELSDGVENINTMGLFNGRPAVVVLVTPSIAGTGWPASSSRSRSNGAAKSVPSWM